MDLQHQQKKFSVTDVWTLLFISINQCIEMIIFVWLFYGESIVATVKRYVYYYVLL